MEFLFPSEEFNFVNISNTMKFLFISLLYLSLKTASLNITVIIIIIVKLRKSREGN